MKIIRRKVLQLAIISGSCFLLPIFTKKIWVASPKRLIGRFDCSFRSLRVLKPKRRDQTTDYYEMKVKKAKQDIIPGFKTEIWGYNGISPGPVIRQTAGRRSQIRFINQLGQDEKQQDINTVVHLHGMPSAPQYDGYAMDFIPLNYYKDYIYPNDRAATLWYHDHVMDLTWRNVSMGLLGMYIIDFSKYPIGTRLYLQNTGLKSDVDFETPVKPIMCFDVVKNETDDSEIPSELRPFTKLTAGDAQKKRTFTYENIDGHWTIDRQVWDAQRIDSYIEPGAIEIWKFINPQKGKLHPVHLHAVEGQILDRNGKPPFPYERGWKDVFHVGGEETVRVILRFATREGHPIEGKYMTHCHHLQHEDNGMMSQFVVGDDLINPVTTAPAQVAQNSLVKMMSSWFSG